MTSESQLLAAITADPADSLAWLALGDWLEEQGESARAELLRLREGLRSLHALDPDRPAREARLHELLAAGVKPAGPRLVLDLPGGIPLEMVLISPGSFWMGTPGEYPGEAADADERDASEEAPESLRPDDDEFPQHRVTLTKGFWISIYPVTQKQWEAVMQANPSEHIDPDCPAEQVSWEDARAFCAALGKVVTGKFRLPKEAEWEYACRAGTTSPFNTGTDVRALDASGWYEENTNGQPRPVGQKRPNAWGLYDMHGNILEYCHDGKRTYSQNEVTDPVGPRYGSRVIRGGYWARPARACRSAYRDGYSKSVHSAIAGFRLVRNFRPAPRKKAP